MNFTAVKADRLKKAYREKFPGAGRANAAAVKLRNAAAASQPFLYSMLDSEPEGLTDKEAHERLTTWGPNEIHHEKAPSWYKQLFNAFLNPFIGILLLIACISFFIDVYMAAPGERDYKTVLMVGIMVFVSAFIRFWQEMRSTNAAEKLRNMVRVTATAIRKDEGRIETEIKNLVPGDVVHLSAGDMVPADCRILYSRDLFISQSMLTGEALPVEKSAGPVENGDKAILELENICFMGTNVISGTATAIVVNTGNLTLFGSMSKAVTGKSPETSFDKGVNKVSLLLIRFMVIMVPLIFVINGTIKGNWWEALLFAIAVAVGLTPEMLPMIVTANLARGAVQLSKRKVIVKRLHAIQNIGAMDVLCTDKTGTLTLDTIVLERHLNILGHEDDEVLNWAYLNSYHQTGLKNLLDVAVLKHVELHGSLHPEENFVKVDELPFDFQRRRMSVILKQADGSHLMICKGAVEEMLQVCDRAVNPAIPEDYKETIPLEHDLRQNIRRISSKLNEDGLRVLLVAIKEYFPGDQPCTVEDERGMTLTGFIGFMDPPKPSAVTSIKALQQLGVNIKVLTGDNEIVTRKICREVGIPVDQVLLGRDIEKMHDELLKQHLKEVSILAKLSPDQKSRIVKLLQESGHTVGFLGDGINDAAALRQADVGITVDTAVDIARESADIILLEKDLTVLRKGVIYGRRTFGNIIKYIKMTASSNFGNMFSMLGASAFLPFLPMLPVQLLVQNLLYDISQISIPWDKMDEEFLERPKKWDASGISRFMIYIGPISSIFDYATFFLMFYFFKANMPEKQSLFQSGWFIEGLLSQTLIVHMIRTRKIPFIQSIAATPVILLTTVIMMIGIAIPFSPFASSLKMEPLPLSYFPWLIGILLSYCLLTQVIKTWFIKKFSQWL